LVAFGNLSETEFSKAVFKESAEIIKGFNLTPKELLSIEGPDRELDERQFYIQSVGHALAHALTWCNQLDLAIKFLSNYEYGKETGTNRADHLIYNVENYLIRLNSVYDRMLHLVNAAFHLCIHDEHVGHQVIVTNIHVTHRAAVPISLKRIKKFLSKYEQARHSIIHRTSLLDKKLRRIEMFYLPGLPGNDAQFGNAIKALRTRYLKEYFAEKKLEFSTVNKDLSLLIVLLFEHLNLEYARQLKRLALVP
jgi:hypothetical protein